MEEQKVIHELPCPHIGELTDREKYDIMMYANSYQWMNDEEKKDFRWDGLYKEPTVAQQEFIDNLKHIIEQDPTVIFDVSIFDLYDEDLAHTMFDGIKLDL